MNYIVQYNHKHMKIGNGLFGQMASAKAEYFTLFENDPKVKIYYDDSDNKNVGYHKNKAFHLGTGDVLVEVDHDDILLSNCLSKLHEIYSTKPDVGFVSSDNAKLHMTAEFIPYNPVYGWQHRKVLYKGKELWAPYTFAPTSHSLAYIWYMPDHVRSWRADVYKMIGGHNPDLYILDDQDLMQRTYMITKFYHIPEVLYIYRITGDNTWLERNADIQTQTVQMGYKNIQLLAERDADLKGLHKIDLGGGIDSRPGYITIDQEGSDIVCDLNDGIPLPDNSVGVINASHVLEHLKDPLKSMKEIHRVLVHGGWAFIEVPSTDGRGAWQDPTHVSFWNENSFLYYYHQNQARYIRNDTIRFMKFRCETHFPSDWWKQMNIPVVSSWLVALKSDEQRFPGIITI
jgi:O-antigen biosynthesis protein